MRIGRVLGGGGVAILGALACGEQSPPGAPTSAGGTTEVATSTTAPDATSTSGLAPTTSAAAASTTDAETSSGQLTTGDDSTGVSGWVSSTGAPPPQCPPGEIVCDGDVALTCDDAGGVVEAHQCAAVCAPALGCVLCVPGTAVCEGAVSKVCRADGQVLEDSLCDPVQGLACDAVTGRCSGACAPDALGSSYIGCDYFPTITPNLVASTFSFAVAVSNTGSEDAHVTITRDDVEIDAFDVAAGDVEVTALPWIFPLKEPKTSAIVQGGAYRLRADRPVSVYQYSPLEYQKRMEFSHSNDASLLLPTNVWGAATRVIARNTLQSIPGAYAVVARRDGTVVEVTPSATGAPVIPGGGVAADGSGKALLNAGDVLVVISGVGGGTPDLADLTGTLVSASAPVQVIGAHACSNVPYNKPACDHLEESNLPLQNLTQGYLLTVPLIKAPKLPSAIKARMVRIVATEENTALSYDPPQAGAPDMLANPGDYGEFISDQDFQVTASARIAVAEYMLGQSAGGETGDPAMTIAVPPELFRSSYAIHAPVHYESNFVNLLAPTGAAVLLDKMPVPPPAWSPIGASGWSAARLPLLGKDDGDHLVECEVPCGVQVYGYGQYTSYWYPGGLDLDPL